MRAGGVWSALGHDAVAGRLAALLDGGERVVVIEGPAGVGKSMLAKGLGGLYVAAGGSAIVLEGDHLLRETELHPFGIGLSELSERHVRTPPSTNSIDGLVSRLLDQTSEAAGRATGFLGDRQHAAVAEIERVSGGRPILLVADNLHCWDSESLALLSLLVGNRLAERFPFLAGLRVVAVQTTESQGLLGPASDNVLAVRGRAPRVKLDRIAAESFGSVMESFGLVEDLSAAEIDTFYRFTGGHLALAQQVVMQINARGAKSLLDAAHTSEFMARLVDERMSALGPLSPQAISLLEVAALLGLAFRSPELLCASPNDEERTRELLRYCSSEQLLELDEYGGRFVHDIFRQFFLSSGAAAHAAMRAKLGSCLRTFRPSDYASRATNANRAGELTAACTLTVQAALGRVREGRAWDDLPLELLDLIEDNDLGPTIRTYVEALEHLRQFRFRSCLMEIEALPRDMPKSLRAEADYIRAMALLSTRSEADRQAGRTILETWLEYRNTEPELGVRLARLQIFGLAHLLDKSGAQRLEAVLIDFLAQRSGFDESARDDIHILDRSSGSILEPDVALVRYERAARYFGPQPGQAAVRRPIEYFRCLSNLCAKQISNAQYRNAVGTYRRLEQHVATIGEDVFPRLDFARMNGILAEYRAGLISAAQALGRHLDLSASIDLSGDPWYAGNAQAVFRALAGDTKSAIDELANLSERLLLEREHPEMSMVYVLKANALTATYVEEASKTVVEDWDTLRPTLEQNVYTNRRFLLRRHDLLREVFLSGEPFVPQALDTCVIRTHPSEFGPLWDNFGRGFRIAAVEAWSDN